MSDIDHFREICWKLIHKESWKSGSTLRVDISGISIIYSRYRCEVEVYWYPSDPNPLDEAKILMFYTGDYTGENADDVTVWGNWPAAYRHLLQQVVLDELADV